MTATPANHDKRRSEVQEALLQLYLRLNGYFITGFIVHSPVHGRNAAEIDALAVRHPRHREPEREVEPSAFLDPSDVATDLLLCEVKSRGQRLRFNGALVDDSGAIATVLRWSWLFEEPEVISLASALQQAMAPKDTPSDGFPTVDGPRHTRIRAALCAPERHKQFANQSKFIHGTEIFAYIARCLCPEAPRFACSVQYDFTGWGRQFEPIVRFFKERGPQAAGSKMTELYSAMGV